MAQNIAIIDLGSNLTKLVIAKNELPLRVIHRSVYDTKTLKSAPKGVFDSVSISKIEQDIAIILDVTSQYNCDTVLGIATSAFRTRKNGQEVIRHINQKFSINIEIIEGNREAQLIYSGAVISVPNSKFPVLVMDIGGGSTEFIIGNGSNILWKHSFDFGSTALTSGMELNDGLTENNLKQINSKLSELLPLLFRKVNEFKPESFIGTTGAFESFSHMIESNNWSNSIIESGYEFNQDKLNSVLDQLISSSKSSRKNDQSIHPLRMETIHIASLILKFVLRKMDIHKMYLSLGDVKEGLALEHLKSIQVN